ncbi:MAG: hypothetical protein SGILL_005447 [Bacillariaceae sp.]
MSSKAADKLASHTTTASTTALAKTKQAVSAIQTKLEPVLKRLRNDDFEDHATTNQAQASVAMSIGMMQHMGARLRGLDQGRNADDPLRKQLNEMKKVLAEIKQRRQKEATHASKKRKSTDHGETVTHSEKKPESKATPSDKPAGGKKRNRHDDAVDGKDDTKADTEATPPKKTKPSPKSASSSSKKKRRRR